MKVINDLLGYKNIKIVQNTDYFSFSLDSVLLANFVTLDQKTRNILDIGTGNAPIPLILSTKVDAMIYGFEIQKEIFEMAEESIILNSLCDKIIIYNDDVKKIKNYFPYECFDLIVTNPPYFKVNKSSILNDEEKKSIARHEIFLNLEDILKISFKYLKNKGRFAMVYRTERLAEVLGMMEKYSIYPKKITMIFPKHNSDSNLFLVEGIKNARSGLKKMNYLIVHEENGEYTDEIKKNFS